MYKIRVPASSANLGPGFDTFGLTLNIYNDFYIDSCDELIIENCQIDDPKNNLVYTSAMKVFESYGIKSKGLYIKFDSQIPLSSGLGSSATCIIAGLVGAKLILGKTPIKEELFHLAASIEGHADNIAAALFGGFTVSKYTAKEAIYRKFTVSPKLNFYILIPNYELSTNTSRLALPKSVDLSSATENIANAALMVIALQNGDMELLRKASIDKLHEPFRADLVPDFLKIKKHALNNGAINLLLSGAGPSLLCIVEDEDRFEKEMYPFLGSLNSRWKLHPVEIDYTGTRWDKM